MVKDAGGTLADFSDGKRIVRNQKCEVRVQDVYFRTLWFLTNPLASVRVRVCRPKSRMCVRSFCSALVMPSQYVLKITRAQLPTLGGCRRTDIDWTADEPPISKPLPPNTFVPRNQFESIFFPFFSL